MLDSSNSDQRVAVDGFTRLTQWDAVFALDTAVLSHADWSVDWVWEGYDTARHDVALTVDGAEAGVATGPAEHVYGRAAERALHALQRNAWPPQFQTWLGYALGWPPSTVAHRTRAAVLQRTLRDAAELAVGLPAAAAAGNIRAQVVPVVAGDGHGIGSLSADDGRGPNRAVVWRLIGGRQAPEEARIARDRDAGLLLAAGWAALAAELAGCSSDEGDAAAIDTLSDLLREWSP